MSDSPRSADTVGGHRKYRPTCVTSGWPLSAYTNNLYLFCVILLVLVAYPGICDSEQTKTLWPSALVVTASSDLSTSIQFEKIIEEAEREKEEARK